MQCEYCSNGVAPFYTIEEVVGGQKTGRETTMCHTCKGLDKQPVFAGQGVSVSQGAGDATGGVARGPRSAKGSSKQDSSDE